jgi:hypothetical protein
MRDPPDRKTCRAKAASGIAGVDRDGDYCRIRNIASLYGGGQGAPLHGAGAASPESGCAVRYRTDFDEVDAHRVSEVLRSRLSMLL